MWKLRLLDIKSNKIFNKEIPSLEYYKFKRKCEHSKKILIISEMRVW